MCFFESDLFFLGSYVLERRWEVSCFECIDKEFGI